MVSSAVSGTFTPAKAEPVAMALLSPTTTRPQPKPPALMGLALPALVMLASLSVSVTPVSMTTARSLWMPVSATPFTVTLTGCAPV
ncbi:MAG: hypothetical protein LBE32_01715 [Burkholderiales bacterium]|nr:hypothetical protein [Burkholderiales bacterium]